MLLIFARKSSNLNKKKTAWTQFRENCCTRLCSPLETSGHELKGPKEQGVRNPKSDPNEGT